MSSSSQAQIKLTPGAIKALACTKQWKPKSMDESNQEKYHINCIDVSPDGEYVVTTSDDESLRWYTCSKASFENELLCKKYGADLVRFTKNKSVVISSKNEFDQTIRLLSLADNKYLQNFKGHRARVVSLAVSPHADKTMASCSMDETLRIWSIDETTTYARSCIKVKGRSAVAFDPKNEQVLAVATAVNLVKLYDLRYADKGPFSTIELDYIVPNQNTVSYTSGIPLSRLYTFTDLQFNSSGTHILASTQNGTILLIDVFKCNITREFPAYDLVFTNPQADSSSLSKSYNWMTSPFELKATFSPDSQFVTCGSRNGSIQVWDTATGNRVHSLKGHTLPVSTVVWNPKYVMLHSGCSAMNWWMPVQPKTYQQ